MASSKYRKEIEGLIEMLNQKTGLSYTTDFALHHGGWCMYQKDSHGGQHSGEYGFYSRVGSREMIAYLNGLLNALQ